MSDEQSLIVLYPANDDLWRHHPPTWGKCYVCGHNTCWIELDIGYRHPDCVDTGGKGKPNT